MEVDVGVVEGATHRPRLLAGKVRRGARSRALRDFSFGARQWVRSVGGLVGCSLLDLLTSSCQLLFFLFPNKTYFSSSAILHPTYTTPLSHNNTFFVPFYHR